AAGPAEEGVVREAAGEGEGEGEADEDEDEDEVAIRGSSVSGLADAGPSSSTTAPPPGIRFAAPAGRDGGMTGPAGPSTFSSWSASSRRTSSGPVIVR